MGKCTLRLHAATYGREAISTLPLEGVDAVFATARTDFGGYSHAYSSFILEHLGLEQSPRTLTELDLQEDQCKRSTPYFIATPVVPNDAAAARALTVELLKLCEKRGFQKVLLTQFIELKSKKDWAKHQNYLGILDALRASTPSKHLELIFCIDRRYQSFYEEAL